MKKYKIITKILIFLFICIIIVEFSFYVYAYITPKFNINTKNNILLYDINNEEYFNDENINNYIELDNISDNIKNAIVSVEDKNFYIHKGFDYLRIIKAIFVNIKSGSIKQGASTISQQYVKNLFLDFNKTWKRKIEEAYLTFELETHYTKEEILEGYLNAIDFGAGNYGIKNASKYYFNKSPGDLSLAEASLIVGIPRNPSYYNPISNYENAKERQKIVLESMVKNNFITKNEMDKAYNEELILYGKRDKTELSSIYYYKDAVMNELETLTNISSSLLETGGLKIYTNLNKEYQKNLEKNIDTYMKDTNLQVASTIIDPKSGKILALIGGKDYSTSQFNRAIYSKRQVGSTIKPFLYYAALENGFTASTTFLSERTSFNIGDSFYSPKNAGNIYANKNISLLSAIAYSDNVYAMKTSFFLGLDKLGETTLRSGIKTIVKDNASSALGTTEINMIDFSNGFITLANEGIHREPYLINKVTDLDGNILYEHKDESNYTLNKKYVYILNNLLTSTYDYNMISYTSPTLISVNSMLDGKYAVKSGSTNTDYWTIGYNKNNLVLVWNGYDDNTDVKSSDSKISKKIWASTINNLEKKENDWYDIPEGLTASIIDPISGELTIDTGILCFYEKGSEPNYTFNDIYDILKEN